MIDDCVLGTYARCLYVYMYTYTRTYAACACTYVYTCAYVLIFIALQFHVLAPWPIRSEISFKHLQLKYCSYLDLDYHSRCVSHIRTYAPDNSGCAYVYVINVVRLRA